VDKIKRGFFIRRSDQTPVELNITKHFRLL
jgi:hypothetical protein